VTTPAAGGPGEYNQGYGQQGEYGQQNYGGQQGYGQPAPPAPPKPRNGLGVAGLVFGILALLTCWIPIVGLVLGIVAIVLGALGRSRVKKMQATNGGVALTGLILGVLSTLVNIAITVLAFVFGVAFLNSGAGQSIQQCIAQAQQAPDPVAAQQACQQQIQQQIQRQIPGGY